MLIAYSMELLLKCISQQDHNKCSSFVNVWTCIILLFPPCVDHRLSYDVGKIWIFLLDTENRSSEQVKRVILDKNIIEIFIFQHLISTSCVTYECECWIPDHLIDLSPEFVLNLNKSSSYRFLLEYWAHRIDIIFHLKMHIVVH